MFESRPDPVGHKQLSLFGFVIDGLLEVGTGKFAYWLVKVRCKRVRELSFALITRFQVGKMQLGIDVQHILDRLDARGGFLLLELHCWLPLRSY